ncbi:MAG: hypothetical protein IJS05_00165 [Paludibacteraceae bacterium]|nr:hypothetical protein [Paludibacteraceae bacterium]
MKKSILLSSLFLFFVITGCTDKSSRQDDESEYIADSHLELWKQQKEFAERILSEPQTFETDFTEECDKLEIKITESPDGKVRFFTWWDGSTGTMISHNNIYQTKNSRGKYHSFDWRDWEKEMSSVNYIQAIRQVETENETIYLIFYGLTEWSSCHAYGVEAYKMNRKGELVPAYVFNCEDLPQNINSMPQKDNLSRYLYIEIYGWIPPSICLDGGWMDNFFFDRSADEIYILDLIWNHKSGNQMFDEMYHRFYWDGEHFIYAETTFNPALAMLIEEPERFILEFELGKLLIRIDQMEDGTLRYTAFDSRHMFDSEPRLIIENGWSHEVEHEYHFYNNDYEYLLNTEEERLYIYKIDNSKHRTATIANYKIENEIYKP